MLKPITFKAAQNFNANLYALEVKSRFINQNNANGYYKGYGDELAATVIGNSGIKIGSGAFLVQGRMVEIVSSETVAISYAEGKVGYILCRIETCPSTSGVNCSLVARTSAALGNIVLARDDTYAYTSEETNAVYELPLYSFGMQNGAIQNVVKLIEEIAEHSNVGERIENINAELDVIDQRINNLSFKSGSITFELPTGWKIISNSITRQGNYVIGSFQITPPPLWLDKSNWFSASGMSTLIGKLTEHFKPKSIYNFGTKSNLYFDNVTGISTYVNYSIDVLFGTDGSVYLVCEGEAPLPTAPMIFCAFGYESPAIT